MKDLKPQIRTPLKHPKHQLIKYGSNFQSRTCPGIPETIKSGN